MRFVFPCLKFFLLVVLILLGMGVAASAQINPATNIRWPNTCYTDLLTVYAPGSNVCARVTPSNIQWPTPSCADPAAFFSPGANACATVTTTGGLPVNNPAYTGAMTGQSATINTLSASVNSQFNVMAPPYNAKGDCATDDTAAFTAAQTAAIAASSGSQYSALYLPKPPGGCYIVNNWVYKGVPVVGQPGGLGPASPHAYNVKLKSTNGNDVVHIPDPLTTPGTTTLAPGWGFFDVSFEADNTVSSASRFPHRWPGRWMDRPGMTSGSNSLTNMNNIVTCGDVGEPVIVGGAGPTAATDSLAVAITSTSQKNFTLSTGVTASWPTVFAYVQIDSEIMLVMTQGLANGTVAFTTVQRGQAGTTAAVHSAGATATILGNLTSTVASVTPCWASPASTTVVTLNDAASNTISNAHFYISAGNLPVTTHIGNCAIAMDMADGDSTDWIGTTAGGNYPVLTNVAFTRTAGGVSDANNCAIYTQGNPYLYGIMAMNIGVYALKFGIVQQTTELNSIKQPSSGDYEQFNHGLFFFNDWPWISANGLSQRWMDLQFTGPAGPQILYSPNIQSDYPNGWQVSMSGYECPASCSSFGWHVQGLGMQFNNVSLASGAAGQYGYWDANSGSGNGGPGVYLNGYGNQFTGNSYAGGTWWNNTSYWSYNASPFGGNPAPSNIAAGPYKGRFNMVGKFTADHIFNGNDSTPYDRDDLILFPNDFLATSTLLVRDDTSPSKYYLTMTQGLGYSQFLPYIIKDGNVGNSLTFGTNFPAAPYTIYFMAKCPSGTTFNFQSGAFGGTNINTSFSCTTSFQTYSMTVPIVSSDIGKFLNMGVPGGGNTIQLAYAVLSPSVVMQSPTLNTASLISPAMTGTPTAPTAAPGDNSTKVATTAFVSAAGTPQPWLSWINFGYAANPNSGSIAGGTNATKVASFISPTTATYSKMTFFVNTIDNSANLYSAGWYNASGNLICSTGAVAGTTFAPATGFVTLPVTPSCTFTSGLRYYFAYTGNAATMKFGGPSGGESEFSGTIGSAVTSGGALNSSITPPTDTFYANNVNTIPWVGMHN